MQTEWGPRGHKPVGVSVVVRSIVHARLQAIRAARAQRQDQPSDPAIGNN